MLSVESISYFAKCCHYERRRNEMQAKYTRLFTDGRGASPFNDLNIELTVRFAVPPAEPLYTAPFLAPDNIFWVGAPTNRKGDTPHLVPRRVIFIALGGQYQVTASDSVMRRFPVGSVLLLVDTEGDGHSTTVTSDEDCLVFAVGLPAASAV